MNGCCHALHKAALQPVLKPHTIEHHWPLLSGDGGVSLLFGLSLLALGKNGWNLIGIWTVIGAIVLCCVPELLLGKYRNAKATSSNRVLCGESSKMFRSGQDALPNV